MSDDYDRNDTWDYLKHYSPLEDDELTVWSHKHVAWSIRAGWSNQGGSGGYSGGRGPATVGGQLYNGGSGGKPVGNDDSWVNDQIKQITLDSFLDEPTQEIKCDCGIWTTHGRTYPEDKHSDWCSINPKSRIRK